MNNEFEELQNKWDDAKGKQGNPIGKDKILVKITAKKNENSYFYYGTLIILLITLIVISLFFYYVAPVKESLSRAGVGFMIGSLIVRIVMEIFSIVKAKRIDILDDALTITDNTIAFYDFRKTIHNSVTLPIVTVYTIGFYMITPEFSLYFSLGKMILIDVSYIVIAIFLVIHIRRGIKKEMESLLDIVQLRKEIVN